jgi:predicted metal-dependent hydrolase
MNYPKEFIQYLAEFHGSRDYFECHEILEEYWKKQQPLDRESIWVGFIQLAVGMYHYRRDNHPGALRTLQKSKQILNQHMEKVNHLGIDSDELLNLLTESIHRLKTNEPYRSPFLPIKDPELLTACQSMCTEYGYSWNCISNLSDSSLVNRHSTRDRTEVIEERFKQLKKRNKDK